ncbi:tripartite tricarboxylate transporter permease [soil metagenome]
MYSFFDAFTLHALIYSCIGAVLGIIWGAMPGLSMTMGMALLAQFSYSMNVYDSTAFLMGVYTGATFGGAISAILINIPGTPDAVPTQLAGYPLTKQGRGGEALGMAIAASFIGNWVGILLLMAFTPVALAFAMHFGAWEQFLLALWGILIAGSLSGESDSALKGWISGWIGLAIAMVGIEPIIGHQRMTFDIPELLGGIQFIPALIGLFGLAEVLRVATEPEVQREPGPLGRVIPHLRDFTRYIRSALRSSALGTIIGVIPGGGGPMATFLAYDWGQKASGKDFSKGSVEGVVCSETANNACIGGSLLPAMSLGIPGTAAAAVFMAALAFQGLVVGPTIDQSQPGFMQFLYGTLIVANLAMYIFGFALIKPSLYALTVRRGILMPLVTVLCVVGAFSLHLSSFDVMVMLVFGVIGYVLRQWEFPLAPMVFAMILGNMADENFRKAMIIFSSDGILSAMLRPIGIVMLAIIAWTLYSGIKASFGEKPKAGEE